MISFKNIIIVSLLLAGVTIDAQAGRSNHRRSEPARARRAQLDETRRANRRGWLATFRETRQEARLARQEANRETRLAKQDPEILKHALKKLGIAITAASTAIASWMLYNASQK